MFDRGNQKEYSFNDIIAFLDDNKSVNSNTLNLKFEFLKMHATKNHVNLSKAYEDVSNIFNTIGIDKTFTWIAWLVNKYIDIRWACPSDLYTDEECYKYALNDLKDELKDT